MAIISLRPGEDRQTFDLDNNDIFGSDLGETFRIGGGTQNFRAGFNGGNDEIVFAGNAAEYSVVRSGFSFVITGPNNTVATIPAPNPDLADAANTIVRFADVELRLDSVVNPDGTATITIGDQEVTTTAAPVQGGTGGPGGVTLDVEATDVTEGGSVVYTFTLSEAAATDVTFTVATLTGSAGGTAQAGSDFTPISQTVTIAAGQTQAFFTVVTADDTTAEGTETVRVNVSQLPAGITLAPGADLEAEIADNEVAPPPPPPPVPQSFELTTGADTAVGGAGDDRVSGVQNVLLPGKLLSQNDFVDGGAGADRLILINAPGGFGAGVTPNVLADVDFTNVSSIEILETNYDQITLGAEAAAAGLNLVDTSTSETQPGPFGPGTGLDITDFNRDLTVVMSDDAQDDVLTRLDNGARSIDTGLGSIDEVELEGTTGTVRVTLASGAVGDDVSTTAVDGGLAVTVQAEDGTGSVTRLDDEGLRLSGGTFNVVNAADGVSRGNQFTEVVLGTSDGEFLDSFGGVSYINGGAGDDLLNGDGGADTLVGGLDDDALFGNAGSDTLLGGAGDDRLVGGSGLDTADGGEGSDTYAFANGEFINGEAATIVDRGTGATDIDTLEIASATDLVDAQFTGRQGFEAVTVIGAAGPITLTLADNAEAAGIYIVNSNENTLDASGYVTTGLVVTGFGDITTGAGADDVTIDIGGTGVQGYSGTVDLNDGDDTLNAGYTIVAGTAGTLDGGAGNDTLELGGAVGFELRFLTGLADNSLLYADPFDANLVGFENVVIRAAEGADPGDPVNSVPATAGNAVSYDITVVAANVEEDGNLTINGSELRAGVVSDLGADDLLDTDDDTVVDETLTVDASTLDATRSVTVFGGAGGDSLTGGAGDDLLVGNAGTDTLEGGLGADTLDGGEDGDTYVFDDADFAADDIVSDSGTAGTDIIELTSAADVDDAAFAGKTGVEELRVLDTTAGVQTVTAGAEFTNTGISTVRVLNNGNDTFDGSAVGALDLLVYTGAGSVLTGAGNDEVRIAQDLNPAAGGALFTANNNSAIELGAGDDTVRTYFNTDYTGTISGGEGADTIVAGQGYSIHTSGTATGNRGNAGVVENVDLSAGDVTGFERLELIGGDAANAATDLEGNTIVFNVTLDDDNVAADTRFVIDGGGLTAGVVTDSVDGDVGNDDDITSDNQLVVNALLSADRSVEVIGGAGDDLVFAGAGADLISGNDGVDLLAGGAGDDIVNGDAGDDTLFGDDGADELRGGEGDDTLNGGAGFDLLVGGAGDDEFVLSISEFNSDNDRLYGDEFDGAASVALENSSDTLVLAGGGEVADVGFNARFFSVEELTLDSGAFTFNAGFFSESAGIDVINIGATATGTINASNRSQRGVTFNDASTGNTVLIGSNFVDTFNVLGAGADSIFARGGNDIVNAGANLDGADILDGGAGTDTLNVGAADAGYLGQAVNLVAAVGASGEASSGIYSFEVLNLAAGTAESAAGANDGTANVYTVNVDGSTFASAGATLTINAATLRAAGAGVATGEDLTVNASGVTNAITVNAGNGTNTIDTGSNADTINGGSGADTINAGSGVDTISGGAGDDIIDGEAGNDVITAGAGADTITGGLGADRVILTEAVQSRDTIVLTDAADAPRAAAGTIETYVGFGVDRDADAATFAGTADVIDFGTTDLVATVSGSVEAGLVVGGTTLGNAVAVQTTFLAAIQLIEQELVGDTDAGSQTTGVIAFQGSWGADGILNTADDALATYIGVVGDNGGVSPEAFDRVVRIEGVSGITDLDVSTGNVGLVVNP